MSGRVNIELVLILLSVPICTRLPLSVEPVYFLRPAYAESSYTVLQHAQQRNTTRCTAAAFLDYPMHPGKASPAIPYTLYICGYATLCCSRRLTCMHYRKAIVQPASSSLHASREHSTEVLPGCSGSEPRSMHIRCRSWPSLSKPSIDLAVNDVRCKTHTDRQTQQGTHSQGRAYSRMNSRGAFIYQQLEMMLPYNKVKT
uniref:Secreted protein n=1 Tax=Trichogramma kaykai TaxID=54128 RepID=A0ABD2W418_9HYME